MLYGVCYFPTDYGADPGEVARLAEDRGFESLLFCEHTHIPTNRETPYPGGGDLPKMYMHTYDPFIACATAAARTREIKVGTGVCLVVERDPIVTAKEVASVDRLCGGRFLFGVGAGWNREEMANHGTDARTRMKLLDERMLAMQQMWTEQEPEFHGDFVDFDPIWSYPKPLQDPLPVLVGGMGPTVEDRILSFGTGWLAQAVSPKDAADFGARVEALQRRAASAGKPRIEISLFAAKPGADAAKQYEAAGIDRLLYLLPDADTATITDKLDQLADSR